jgi:hypothetical protein
MTFSAAQQRNAGKHRIRGSSKETPECSGFSSGLGTRTEEKPEKQADQTEILADAGPG